MADGKANGVLHLFLRHRDRLESFLARRVGCRAAAADLVQDLFLRLWERRLDNPEAATGYLFRSARNLAIDHLRAETLRASLPERLLPGQQGDAAPSPGVILAARQSLAAVDAALDGLPERTRHVFLLNRVHGRTYADIARALGVSVSTVEKDMMRALAACRASLAGEDGDRDGGVGEGGSR